MTRLIRWLSLAMVCVLALAAPISGWDGHGHMLVAFLAYQQLDATQRAKADALVEAIKPADVLKKFKQQVAALPKIQRAAALFALAATWPDEIRGEPGYSDDGVPGTNGEKPQGPTSSQNKGYADKLHHKYWHFDDHAFSRDGTSVPAHIVPNASERVGVFRAALASPGSSLDLKSYDFVWLLHLVGDLHQPLHATTRVSKTRKDGDAGGNLVFLCPKPCKDQLHGFWDGASGTIATPASVMAQAKTMHLPMGADTADLDPAHWANESFELAKSDAYTAPVGEGSGPFALNSKYRTNAGKIAQARVELAAARLANILKADLK